MKCWWVVKRETDIWLCSCQDYEDDFDDGDSSEEDSDPQPVKASSKKQVCSSWTSPL